MKKNESTTRTEIPIFGVDTKNIIQKFLEIVDRDGKYGKDLAMGYVIRVLEEILTDDE
jgi:hypothetical protein